MQQHSLTVARPVLVLLLACSVLACSKPPAEKPKYDPGVTDTEIKIGQTMPYSGPASAYGTIGRAEAAYFKKINEAGGINGRKINFISVDDAYSPPKAVEQVRKLVEEDQVLAIFQPLGTPSNTAIQKYLNTKKVPQLFVSTGATKWGDPKQFPWTIGFNPSYQLEAKTYAQHLLKTKPDAKAAVLYQNDDFGKDYLTGLKETLGAKASMIVKEVSYEVTDATIDSQMATLQASGATVFFNIATPKFAAQAIRKAFDSGWKPTQYLSNVSASVGAVLTPAGLDKSVGVITTAYLKDPTDKQWDNDPAMKEYLAFLAKYYPEAKPIDGSNLYGMVAAQTLEQVLKQCGNDLTRENVMKQAANLKDFAPGLLQPGVKINTGPDDFFLFDTLTLAKFNGTTYEPLTN
jgi:branched-chain amino acid transport system substrate-binding protein